MKKLILMASVLCLALTGCEDVPAPYQIFTDADLEGGNQPQQPVFQPEGDGTAANPWNVASANLFDPGVGVTTTTEYYVRGRISQLKEFGDSYGNYTYYISDDGSTASQYYVYRGYALDGAKFTAADNLSVGDSVIICGKIVNYNGTLEFAQGNKLVYLNGKTSTSGGSSEPAEPVAGAQGSGTASDPYNVAGVLNYTNALPADQNSASEVYFSGIVSSVKEISTKDNFNNATFYLSDDGSKEHEFYVYRCLGVNKADIFSADLVKAGDKVTVCGKVVNYRGDTPETVQKEAYIVSINGETTNPGETPDQPGVDPDQPAVDAEQITIATFLAQKDTQTTYRLTGVVRNIVNTLYGNFDLEDSTGKIYVYGLLNAAGETKQFESLGIKEGDELTLEGVYSEYNNSPQIKNAQYISHKPGEGGNDNPGGNDTPDTPVVTGSIQNGDFEAWTDGKPDHWTTKSSAGNATLSQSTDAHGGKYSVLVKSGGSSNKRLAYEETTFEAGTYQVTFYAKSMGGATSSYGAQCRPGYATFNADGTINGSGYKYGDYASLTEGQWVLVTYEFTLETKQQICPLIMNPKECGDILIDDYTLIKK